MFQQRKSMTAVYASIVITLIVAFLIWRSYRHPSERQVTATDVAQEMQLRAQQAVECAARQYGITLDYSPGSVEKVEEILAQVHDQHNQTPIDHAQLTKEALKWGGYVGEVIKTQKTSQWAVDSSVGGSGSLPIVYNDKSESFPVRWCYNRIVNGDEDNVWHKFKFFALDGDNSDGSASNRDRASGDNRLGN